MDEGREAAVTAPYDEIVFFGDSLSDSGRGAALFETVLSTTVPPAAAGYVGGAYTNGPVFADVLPGLFGLPAGASTNFAVGSARAAGPYTIGDVIAFSDPEGDGIASLVDVPPTDARLSKDVSLAGQIADYAAAGGAGEGTTLASVFIGTNDLLAILEEIGADGTIGFLELLSIPGRIAAVADALADGLAALPATGVDAVALFPFADITAAPLAAELSPSDLAAAQQFVDLANVAVEAVAAGFAGTLPTTLVDLSTVIGEVGADPATFGILEPDTPQVLGDGIRADAVDGELVFVTTGVLDTFAADEIGFFDLIHPGVAVHGVIAAHTARQLTSHYGVGEETDDRIDGTAADDFFYGGGGPDILRGFAANDALFGGLGDDFLLGNAGYDLIAGGSGNDRSGGGGDADVMIGGAGNDALHGGVGRDILVDGLGSDRLAGSRGRDTFIWQEPALAGGGDGDFDEFRGGGGKDRAILVVSDETAADAAFQDEVAALEAAIAEPGVMRGFTFTTIGLEVRNVEEVTVLGPDHVWTRSDFAGWAPAPAVELALEADLWGLI